MQNLGSKEMAVTDKAEEQLVEIFNNYYPKIYAYYLSSIRHREQAQDLTGEVFFKVAASWQGYDPEKGAISTWIFTIARNLLRDYWRKKRHVEVELQEVAVHEDPAENLIEKENKLLLNQALATLPRKEQELIALKYQAGLKNHQIADLTGLSQSNVGVILHRTLKKLQKMITSEKRTSQFNLK